MELNLSQKKLSEGDIIQCPKCNVDICQAKTDVLPGELRAANFKFLIKEQKSGEAMLCPICHFPFFMNNKLFVKGKGWF